MARLDAGRERLAAGDARGALSAAEKLLVEADEANDKSLVALAQQLAGGALALEGRHGEAAARLEDAAEWFHEIGDTTHEIQTLERLANAYRALDDESRVADAVARKQTMQSPAHQQHQQPPQRHEGEALGDSGDSRSPPSEPPAPASESKLLGMLRFRSGAEHRAWQLREVEADKQVLRELRSVVGGLSRSDDDAHLQSHMKQVRFADLPGAAVEARLRHAEQAMTALEQRVSRFYRCLRELVWVSSSGKESGEERAEAAGSLSAALEGWDECAVEWGRQADRRSQEIKDRVLVPLGKMRVSYRGIGEHFSGLTGSLARAAASVADEVSAARKVQARARSKVAEAEARLDACRSLPGDEGGSPKMTFSESMGALLGARRLSAQERAAEALRKARAESGLADSAAFVSHQRLEAARGALAVARRQAAREFEAVEQVRLDVFAGMLRELCDAQTALLAGWQDATWQLAARVQLVDTASDLRTLNNRTLIRAVLEGKAAPTTLLCPPPSKYRQASSGPRLDENDEAEEVDEEETAEGQDKQGDPAPTRADALEPLDSRDGVAGASEAAAVLPPEPPAVQADSAGASALDAGEGDVAQAQIDAFLARLSRHSDATDLGRPAQEQDRAADGAVVKGVMEAFEQRASRDYFLRRLNTFRSTKTRVAKSVMDDLGLVFIAFLDAVYISGDVRAAKICLILSETFFTEEEGSGSGPGSGSDEASITTRKQSRAYVQDSIKNHGIWRSGHFWEETFWIAVREEVLRNVVRPMSPPDKGSARRRSLSQANLRNIVYGQMGATGFNMLSVGMPRSQVESCLRRMAIGNGIAAEETAALLGNLFSSRS